MKSAVATRVTTAAAAAVTLGSLAVAPAAMAQTTGPVSSSVTRSCVLYAGQSSVHCFGGTSRMATFEKASSMKGWVVVGYFYSKRGYAGARLTVKAPTGCTTSTRTPDWSWKAITPAWNNRVRSYVTRRHCDLKGYNGYNYTGAHFKHYSDHDSYMPYWGGKISSFRMS